MKKLILIPLLFIAFLASAQKVDRQEVEQMQKQIEDLTMKLSQADSVPKAVPVAGKMYVTKFEDGFALMFLDRVGGLDAVENLRLNEFAKTGKIAEYSITVLWDERLSKYRLAETVSEYRLEESDQVIKIPFIKIEDFKRSVIE